MSPAPLRRRRSTFNPFLAGLLGLLGIVGILLTLHFTDRVQLPFVDTLFGREVHAQAKGADLVPVILTARDLDPGEAVKRSDVWDVTTQNFKVHMMPRENVRPEWILRWGDIEGRVMARAKSKDKAFKDSDFLPKGTRPGVASLVPAGMRMVTIPPGRITGLETLNYEDRFDLISQRKIDDERIEEAKRALNGVNTGTQLDIEALRGKARRTRVCKDAMRLPDLPTTGSGSRPSVAIAVAESEVHFLLRSLEGKDDLACVVYPGNDVDWADRMTPVEYDPESELNAYLDSTREVRINAGGEQRTVRVNRHPDDIRRSN